MLVEDTTAFVEKIEVAGRDRHVERIRRRLARAELDVLEAQLQVRLARDALARIESAVEPPTQGEQAGRARLGLGASRKPSKRAVDRARSQLGTELRRLDAKRARLARVQEEARGIEQSDGTASAFRLHSRSHFLECSESRFLQLSELQRETPVLVARRDGRRWWWYSDRFWWDDVLRTPQEVKALVLELDLERRRPTADAEELAAILAGTTPTRTVEMVPDDIRRVVWRRESGRCVDCGAAHGLSFQYIIPLARGGSQSPANVDLRCGTCSARRVYNELRASTSRARLDAEPRHADSIPSETRLEVWHRDEGKCVDCGSRDWVDVDHIVSVVKGGSHEVENLELRCDGCRARRVLAGATSAEAPDDDAATSLVVPGQV